MNGEITLEILRKRNEIVKSNLPDDLKEELLKDTKRPWFVPRGLENIREKHSSYLANRDIEADSEYVQFVIRFYEEVYNEASVMLADWREFFEELDR